MAATHLKNSEERSESLTLQRMDFQVVKHLDCSRSVQQLDSSTTKPCCWNRCRMCFNSVLLKYARPSLKKRADVAVKPVYTFQH